MSNNALLTFKAGRCLVQGKTVTPQPEPGYVYLYNDELPHFCWRTRDVPGTEPAIDLTMVPGDGIFEPLAQEQSNGILQSPTNGRIFQLRFESSSQKHYFYLQSKHQDSAGKPSAWSDRDLHLGNMVTMILNGEEVDAQEEMTRFQGGPRGGAGGDSMDVDEPESSTGGAGAGATGGDARREGESSREGGADGGRAAPDAPSDNASDLVQAFLKSVGSGSQQSEQLEQSYTTLADLLTPVDTLPFLDHASDEQVDILCHNLPIELFEDADAPHAGDRIANMSVGRKKAIVTRVLRSAQLQQSLGSLTIAIRDGGLPMISESLGIEAADGGFMHGSSVPLGGSRAVKAFVEGVRDTVSKQ